MKVIRASKQIDKMLDKIELQNARFLQLNQTNEKNDPYSIYLYCAICYFWFLYALTGSHHAKLFTGSWVYSSSRVCAKASAQV